MDAKTPTKCVLCGVLLLSNQRFHWHVRLKHGLPVQRYYELHEFHPCAACGKKIAFYKSRPMTYGKLFCSNYCSGHARHSTKHMGWKGGAIVEGYRKMTMWAYDEKYHDILRPMIQGKANHNYILEHRAVMAIHLGRTLTPRETVHHLNGDRLDNRLENLQLHAGGHGPGATATALICPHCGKSYA